MYLLTITYNLMSKTYILLTWNRTEQVNLLDWMTYKVIKLQLKVKRESEREREPLDLIFVSDLVCGCWWLMMTPFSRSEFRCPSVDLLPTSPPILLARSL